MGSSNLWAFSDIPRISTISHFPSPRAIAKRETGGVQCGKSDGYRVLVVVFGFIGLPGKVKKVIPPIHPSMPEKAEIR